MTLNWAPWEGARTCTGSPTYGARSLLAWLVESYSTGSSMGIYNCRTVRGGSTTSLHGEGRAVDWGMPLAASGRGTVLGHSLVQRLGEHGKRLGIQTVIYDRKIWSAKSPAGRYYGGVHPHYDHLHIELTWVAARNLNLATLRAVLGTTSQEAGMSALKRGDKGNSVALYQGALLKWRDPAAAGVKPDPNGGTWERALHYGADGDYGTTTEEMVKSYQGAADLDKTGVIDGVTAANLMRYMLDQPTAAGLTRGQADKVYAAKAHGHPHSHAYSISGTTGRT